MRRSARSLRLFVLTALMLLAACAPGAAPAQLAASRPAGASPATGNGGVPEPTPVNFAITSWLSVNFIDMVAVDKGFLAAEGIQPEIILSETSVKGTTILVGGSADISNNSPDSVIVAVEKGADLAIVAEEIARPVYSIIAQPQYRTLTDLRGQKVAVSDLKSGATLILLRTLEHGGLRPSEVDIVPVGGTPARYAALKSGAVAAGAMVQPDDFRAMDEGFVRLATSTAAVPAYTFNTMNVRRQWARENADVLVRFLRGYRRAAGWLQDPANKEEAIRILAERTRQEEKYARQTYELVIEQERSYSDNALVRPEGIRAVIDLLAESGELNPPLPPPEKYIDTSYWERARP